MVPESMFEPFNVAEHQDNLLLILREIVANPDIRGKAIDLLLKQYPRDGKGFYARKHLIQAYRELAATNGLPPFDPTVVERLQRKPIRTISGVTPMTVLTKPFPCPGTCIFCPNDIRMPKSYLADEPGAQRAEANAFDPYLQTYSRLLTYRQIGHNTDKIEIIILGGTWSFYPEPYQIWFVKRIFDAMHDFGKGLDRREEVEAMLRHTRLHPLNLVEGQVDGRRMIESYNQMINKLYKEELAMQFEYATWEELEAAHRENENAPCRSVGLVIETRPDYLDEAEAVRLRRLGCTKIQIGIQSMSDDVLRANKRGHDVQRSRDALRALRKAGFKIHAHWMPNLYGSTPEQDIEDFQRLFTDPDIQPDELKVYPCSLIESAELMQFYERGEWRPYEEHELLKVLMACFQNAPEYVRLTRVIRDIPSTDIVVGNKKTNFRQLVEEELQRRGIRSREIRSREIGGQKICAEELTLKQVSYPTSIGEEIFLQYVTEDDRIAGFLRLLLPYTEPCVPELANAAMIREVHVYGRAVGIGQMLHGKAQHAGLGTNLIEYAVEIAAAHGFPKLAVISAVGTREYYRKRGFEDGELYQIRTLK